MGPMNDGTPARFAVSADEYGYVHRLRVGECVVTEEPDAAGDRAIVWRVAAVRSPSPCRDNGYRAEFALSLVAVCTVAGVPVRGGKSLSGGYHRTVRLASVAPAPGASAVGLAA